MLTITTKNESKHQQRSFTNSTISVGNGASCDLIVEEALANGASFTIEQVRDESGSCIAFRNHGRSIALSSGPRLHRGRNVRLELPLSFCIGTTQFQIFDPLVKQKMDQGLTNLGSIEAMGSQDEAGRRKASPAPETLASWLETLSELQQVAAGSRELFDLAAQAIFNPGGLDGGMVLLPTKDGWRVESSFIPYPDHGICFREDLVELVVKRRQTMFHDSQIVDSLTVEDDLHCAVACPVSNAENEIVAVIYGFRSLHRRNNRQGIRFLETQFVQVVADSLSAGMIRLDSEADAARSQVLLEQVFPPRVANQLRTNPQFLNGQDKEVTVLFADMRGFSGIAERMGTQATYELLTDVMDHISNIITDLDGVIIDYYGDGVSAFWNAPIEQPEHAAVACQAALEILNCLPEINRKWSSRLHEQLRIGIGINTGISRVGNSGSSRRLKYGPRGSVVNIASRLENATKDVGVPIIISGSTAEAISHVFKTRRIANTNLKGHEESADIFQFFMPEDAPPSFCIDKYEEALKLYENGNTNSASETLAELSQLYPKDEAVRYLLGQARSKSSKPESTHPGRPKSKTSAAQK